MSSDTFSLEFNGKRYDIPLDGQPLTGDFIKNAYEKIAQEQKQQQTAQTMAASSGGGVPVEGKVEDKKVIETQENFEDALKAKYATIDQAAQANFDDVAIEKTKESSVSNKVEDISSHVVSDSYTVDSDAEDLNTDLSSEVAQKLAAEAIGVEVASGLSSDIAQDVAIQGIENFDENDDVYSGLAKETSILDANLPNAELVDEKPVQKEEKLADSLAPEQNVSPERKATPTQNFEAQRENAEQSEGSATEVTEKTKGAERPQVQVQNSNQKTNEKELNPVKNEKENSEQEKGKENNKILPNEKQKEHGLEKKPTKILGKKTVAKLLKARGFSHEQIAGKLAGKGKALPPYSRSVKKSTKAVSSADLKKLQDKNSAILRSSISRGR